MKRQDTPDQTSTLTERHPGWQYVLTLEGTKPEMPSCGGCRTVQTRPRRLFTAAIRVERSRSGATQHRANPGHGDAGNVLLLFAGYGRIRPIGATRRVASTWSKAKLWPNS